MKRLNKSPSSDASFSWEYEEYLIRKRLAYSLKEVSDWLGVSIGHLRNENKRGKLEFFKSGRRTLIQKPDLEDYLGRKIHEESAEDED